MIRPPDVRKAMQTVQAFRRQQRKARAPKIVPTAKGQRQPRIQEPGYLAFIRRQPCIAAHLGGCGGRVEAAHIRMALPGKPITGIQRKPDDYWTAPVCSMHHREGPQAQHHGSEAAWWRLIGKDPVEECARLRAQYERE